MDAGVQIRYLQLNWWVVGIFFLTSCSSCFVRYCTSPCSKNTGYLVVVCDYLLSMSGLVLHLNTSVSFQTEGLQIHKYLSYLHRMQDILPFRFLYIYISNLTERPVFRDVAEEGNIFQMIHRRWWRYARDAYAPYSSEEREWRTLHEGRLYPLRVQRFRRLKPDDL